MIKVGKIQLKVLRLVYEQKGWHAGCGWIWDTGSGTRRLLNSLAKKGLVDVTVKDRQRPQKDHFKINEKGKGVLFNAYPLLNLLHASNTKLPATR